MEAVNLLFLILQFKSVTWGAAVSSNPIHHLVAVPWEVGADQRQQFWSKGWMIDTKLILQQIHRIHHTPVHYIGRRDELSAAAAGWCFIIISNPGKKEEFVCTSWLCLPFYWQIKEMKENMVLAAPAPYHILIKT